MSLPWGSTWLLGARHAGKRPVHQAANDTARMIARKPMDAG